MALTVISPWPATTATVALAAAIACVRDATGIGDDDTAHRIGATASALVERFAPGAPDTVRSEACLRVCGWLWEQPKAAIRSHSEGPMSLDFAPTHTGALRHSGSDVVCYHLGVGDPGGCPDDA